MIGKAGKIASNAFLPAMVLSRPVAKQSVNLRESTFSGGNSLPLLCTAIFLGSSPTVAATMTVSAPTEWFSQATATSPLLGYTDLFVPVPGANTGQVSASVATVTNPYTSVDYGGGDIATGSASATADRALAQLHAAAGATTVDPLGYGFGAQAEAQFGDTLYFTAADANPTTRTYVGFTVQIDGSLSGPAYGSNLAYVELELAVGAVGSMGGFDPPISSGVGTGNVSLDLNGNASSPVDDLVDETLTGTFSFEGPSATVPILMSLQVGGGYGFANFSDTVTFSFDPLPAGVSYTSASGDFLTGSVPEPSTWAMLLIGFASLGYAGYARMRARVGLTGTRSTTGTRLPRRS